MRVLLISDPNITENEPNTESEGVDNMAYSSADEDDIGKEENEEIEDEEEDGSDGDQESNETDEESDFEPESTESTEIDGGGSKNSKKNSGKGGERMAAAALCVNVGSFSDPGDLPGLAHFLEHMVFMGSKKFPEENAFDEYLKVATVFKSLFCLSSLLSCVLRRMEEVRMPQPITKLQLLNLKSINATSMKHWKYLPSSLPPPYFYRKV